MLYGTKEIVKIIVNKIKQHEFKLGEQLPSEQQLAIRYGVSRIVATRVYQQLIKLGAIYSIQRQGYFVSRYFPGLLLSLSDDYQIDKFVDEINDFTMSEFMNQQQWTIENPIKFERKYYKSKRLIIVSQQWVDAQVHFEFNKTQLDSNLEPINLVSSITISRFEPSTLFNQTQNLVSYCINYDKQHQIKWIVRYIVDPEIFCLINQRFNI